MGGSALKLKLTYATGGDLAAHLDQLQQQGALLVPLPEGVTPPEQYAALELQLELQGQLAQVSGEALQVIPGLGVAVSLADPAPATALVDEPAAPSPQPPQVALVPDEPQRARGVAVPQGSSPLSWPIEKLMSDWHTLTMPEKIRVARHGKRPARAFVMRQQDSQLHAFLLANPKISAEEVAVLAGMGNLDSSLLKRLVSSPEWTRHTAVVRKLVCHPKVTMPQVTRLVDKLPTDELRRLTKGGMVKAAVKALIIKKLERRAGR